MASPGQGHGLSRVYHSGITVLVPRVKLPLS